MREIDDISDGIGLPEWRLTLFLLLSWFITFLVSIRGVKSSGKASYFLALFPYVIMITLLIRAATLEGAADGMFYFIETDWNRLLDADVSGTLLKMFLLHPDVSDLIQLVINKSHNDICRCGMLLSPNASSPLT